MFFTVFATFSALLSLYSQSASNYHDFNHMITVRRATDDDAWSDYTNQAASSLGTTEGFIFSDLDNTYQDNSYQYRKRYYISQDISNNTDLGYIDFYFRVSSQTDGYLYPTIETHFAQTFNFELDVNWQILNSDFPSLVPFDYSYHFDFSKQENLNYYYTRENGTSMITVYTNANDKNSMRMLLAGSPMDQAAYNFYNNTYQDGFDNGYSSGKDDGYNDGYQVGYSDGISYGSQQDATALVIFQGIISVGLLPINFFLAMLNFEVFGINIGGAISAMLTIAIVVIIIRIVVSGGNGGGKE